MAKNTVYVCSECGEAHTKWQGQCKSCHTWNTLSAFSPAPSSKNSTSKEHSGFSVASQKVRLDEITPEKLQRFSSGEKELDRVLGGGLVPGSLILLGGQPGAGKSTLLLECIAKLSQHKKVLYVSGEETANQIALRAQRLSLEKSPILLMTESRLEQVSFAVKEQNPDVLVVDSIQVMQHSDVSSSPGSVSQVRACATELMRLSKERNMVTFIVGHVTKDGQLAGPKVLEHAVDCSLLLESMDDLRFRILRALKNRFGAVGEMGIFQMSDKGLRAVSNPSAIFLSHSEPRSGSVIVPVWEGSRALMVEMQSLVVRADSPTPRRLTLGFESIRAAMLMAVGSRFSGVSFSGYDVFCNVVGGVKIEETSADLPFLVSLLSSLEGKILQKGVIIFGELGLGGEIRPVPQGEARLLEALKHGFHTAIIPKKNMPRKPIEGLSLIPCSHVHEILEKLPWQ